MTLWTTYKTKYQVHCPFFAWTHICSSLIAMTSIYFGFYFGHKILHFQLLQRILWFSSCQTSLLATHFIMTIDQWSLTNWPCLLSEICVCKYFWIVHVFCLSSVCFSGKGQWSPWRKTREANCQRNLVSALPFTGLDNFLYFLYFSIRKLLVF